MGKHQPMIRAKSPSEELPRGGFAPRLPVSITCSGRRRSVTSTFSARVMEHGPRHPLHGRLEPFPRKGGNGRGLKEGPEIHGRGHPRLPPVPVSAHSAAMARHQHHLPVRDARNAPGLERLSEEGVGLYWCYEMDEAKEGG